MARAIINGFEPVNTNVASVSTEANRQDNQLSTGLYSGGQVSINSEDPTRFDISAGSGVIVDLHTNPDVAGVAYITWEAKIGILAEHINNTFTSIVGIGRDNSIIQFEDEVTAEQRRDYIVFSLLVHTSGTVIESVSNQVVLGYDQANTLNDLAATIGIINSAGNIFSAASTDLTVAKSIGTSFKAGGNYYTSRKSTNMITTAGLTAPTLFKPYRTANGDFTVIFPLTTTIDVTKYDDGSGTLASVPANSPWTIWRIYHDPVNNDVIAHYPQNTHKTLAAAEASIGGEPFTPNPVLRDSLLRCFLIVKRDCTNLSNTAKAEFIAADKFGITKAIGALSNVPAFSDILAATTPEFLASTTANRPTSPVAGQTYFDTTLGYLIAWNGSDWVNGIGTEV